ncbi:MAG: type II toxin-antitoxin system Phd/YefM family antitoxin [Candidatus Latescibacteria bacterium]|nr:type II toxin-antitoxin system Phd/YefM family antitoxin [Candidatus Latescibacterota bacterium]
MLTKIVSSTEAQNNFGQIMDSVVQESTRYVIKRRNTSQAIIMSLSDLNLLLSDETERRKVGDEIRGLAPVYRIGETLTVSVPRE